MKREEWGSGFCIFRLTLYLRTVLHRTMAAPGASLARNWIFYADINSDAADENAWEERSWTSDAHTCHSHPAFTGFHNIYNTLQYNGHIAQACGAHLYPSRLHREWRGSLTEITLISFIVELTMNSPSTRFGWAAEHTKRQVYYSERY